MVAKIILGLHDPAKDKPLEVELGWISAETGWKYELVATDRRDAAVVAAKAMIEAEEDADVEMAGA